MPLGEMATSPLSGSRPLMFPAVPWTIPAASAANPTCTTCSRSSFSSTRSPLRSLIASVRDRLTSARLDMPARREPLDVGAVVNSLRRRPLLAPTEVPSPDRRRRPDRAEPEIRAQPDHRPAQQHVGQRFGQLRLAGPNYLRPDRATEGFERF